MKKTLYNKLAIAIIGCLFMVLGGLVSQGWALPFNSNRPFNNFTFSGEKSLQTVLDNTFGTGTIDAVNDQNTAAIWTQTDMGSDAYLVTLLSAAQDILGIYSYTTGQEYLFSDLNSTGKVSFTINNSGDLYVGNTLAFSNFGHSFGFYIRQNGTSNFYTEDDKNSGNDASGLKIHALTYLIQDGTVGTLPYLGGTTTTFQGNDDWVLAFNDGGGDKDFQDAVFVVEDMQPVPEPATILLFGTGLIGIAGFARRKVKKA